MPTWTDETSSTTITSFWWPRPVPSVRSWRGEAFPPVPDPQPTSEACDVADGNGLVAARNTDEPTGRSHLWRIRRSSAERSIRMRSAREETDGSREPED
jgi:hypothetical protein